MTEKLKRQNSKFRKAIEAGARLAEMSISKLSWDAAHKNIKVVAGKLDYRVHQVLDCAAYLIAKEEWFSLVLGSEIIPNKLAVNAGDREYPFVAIPYRTFKEFIADEKSLKTAEVVGIFKKVPEVILEGKTNIPYCPEDGGWMNIELYKDNICGVAVARESKEFTDHRSDRRMRGKGAGREEPVCILVFSNPYGLAFFYHAMHRRGTQLQDPELYHLHPKAQELFQSVRWNNGFIVLNTEQASRAMNLVWPLGQKPNLYKRVNFIRKMLKILKNKEFINYIDETYEQGRTIDRKAWGFYVRKRKLIGIEDNKK